MPPNDDEKYDNFSLLDDCSDRNVWTLVIKVKNAWQILIKRRNYL